MMTNRIEVFFRCKTRDQVCCSKLIGQPWRPRCIKPIEYHNYEERLRGIRHDYFNARTRKDKLRCIDEDKKLRQAIAETLKKLGMQKSIIELLAHWDP